MGLGGAGWSCASLRGLGWSGFRYRGVWVGIRERGVACVQLGWATAGCEECGVVSNGLVRDKTGRDGVGRERVRRA